jgi:hypothetical protein
MASQNNEIWVGIDDNKVLLSGAELENYLIQLNLDKMEAKRIDDESAAKAAEKSALLLKLGITAEEAALLLS